MRYTSPIKMMPIDLKSETRLIAENERLQRELIAERRGKTNWSFVQVSKKDINALATLSLEAPKAHFVLWKLVGEMNRQNALLVSQDTLKKLTGLSRPTLQRAVAVLRDRKWISTTKVGTTNVYHVNSSVFWQARAEGKFATFSAQVIADWEEQDEQTKAEPAPNLRHMPTVEEGEEVIVLGAALGSDDPPEQAQIDFHKGE